MKYFFSNNCDELPTFLSGISALRGTIGVLHAMSFNVAAACWMSSKGILEMCVGSVKGVNSPETILLSPIMFSDNTYTGISIWQLEKQDKGKGCLKSIPLQTYPSLFKVVSSDPNNPKAIGSSLPKG